MQFDEARFERYAMQAETTIESKPGKWVSVDEIGAALNFTSHESRFIADHLESEGWVELSKGTDVLNLKLTLKGFKEIAKLRRHPWRRWLERHWCWIVAIGAPLGGIVGASFRRRLKSGCGRGHDPPRPQRISASPYTPLYPFRPFRDQFVPLQKCENPYT